LEDENDTTFVTPEGNSPQLEWWGGHIDMPRRMRKKRCSRVSFTMIRDEERVHAPKSSNVAAANDALASAFGVAATSSTDTDYIM
jgi:hypothetical protein